MILYGRQEISSQDVQAVKKALTSSYITQGPTVFEFERFLAKYCGAKYAVAVSSGTAALHLAYLAADFEKGAEVITTPNTFAATSNMLLVVGAKPVFCDIRLDTYNIDETKIEKLITKKTRAIVPVDFAGHPSEIKTIRRIARKHKLMLIEDAAPALGAIHKNMKIGSLSDMTIFSFHAVKTITTGEGGAILTNDEKLYQKILHLRTHGIQKDKNSFNVMTELGYNYRLTEFQSALGLSQLKRIEKFLRKRHDVVRWYKKLLNSESRKGNILLPRVLPLNRSAWHIYVIRVGNAKDKIPLYNYLKKGGVGVNFHYTQVPTHPYYRKLRFSDTKLSNSKEYAETAITLPLHTSLTFSDVNYIAGRINDFFKNRSGGKF